MANLFRKQAELYAKARPDYPISLFKMLSSLTTRHELAWDVGTGSGQSAVVLNEYYKNVVATDANEQQLSHAVSRPNVKYVHTSEEPTMEELEDTVGKEGTVDLVTVSQALHWFNFDHFYPQVKHVLRKPGGVFAAWCYTLPSVSPAVDAVLGKWYAKSNPYWASERDLVDAEYKTIPFPFEPVQPHGTTGPIRLDSVKEWNLHQYLEYLNSSSAVQTARDQGVDLLGEGLREAFNEAWGKPDDIRNVTFPIWLRMGTVSP